MVEETFVTKQLDNGTFEVLKLSVIETKALILLAETNDPVRALESGLTMESLSKLMEEPAIRNHVYTLQERLRKAANVTEARFDAILDTALTGVEAHLAKPDAKLGRDDIATLNLVADRKGLKKQKIDIEVKNANPFANMTDEQFKLEAAARLAWDKEHGLKTESIPG